MQWPKKYLTDSTDFYTVVKFNLLAFKGYVFCDIWLKSKRVAIASPKTSPKIAYFHRWELILDEKAKGYAYLINGLFCTFTKSILFVSFVACSIKLALRMHFNDH